MRCLGQIHERKAAERFVAFLLTQGITTQVEPVVGGEDQWEVWVRDEDRIVEALALLREFQGNPLDAKYQQAVQQASEVLQQQAKRRMAAAQNMRKVRYQSSFMQDRRVPPLTLTLIILSCVVSIFSNFGSPGTSNEIGQSIRRQMSFVSGTDLMASQGDPAASLKKGQLWRVITPIFIHLSPMHLVFNVLGMIVLGRVVERWLGPGKYAMFVLVAAVLPNLLQGLAPPALHGSPLFGGISGVVYALFGLVWLRSLMNPMLGIYIPFVYVMLMIVPIAIGMSGVIPGWRMADLCHLGGLMVGAAVAFMMEQRR